ncbi:DUF4349 domain-containing protein [Alkalihalobacillus sp. CinArs1]|uniref:DUF4349 domain-containing protein n=1 Tax=Alkalihalobacillus sp. CinArs1 TaxID=2995314 RepID=UPI0022DDE1C3|nr:DUF4349 domain-containing protein [Alkalihalobacillus sp. CinArs1]
MKKYLLFSFVIAILILTACSSNQQSESGDSGEPLSEEMDRSAGETKESASDSSSSNETMKMPELQTDRKVIFNANLSLTVEDLSDATGRLKELLEANGGYIVESRTFSEEETNYGSMTVRVPQDNFYPFLDEAETIGKGTPEKSVTGTDVTEEFVDLEARLKAKEDVRDRLQSFLEKAEKTEDLLAISNDLSRVQEEIEQLKGRMNYLNNQSDYSTVTVSLEEKKIKVPTFGEGDKSTIAEAKQLFMKTANGILSFFSKTVVVLIGLSPVLVPLAALTLFFFIRNRRRKKSDPNIH